jgi:hypothetical protein
VSFPSPTVAAPSPHNRGGYPFRDGAGTLEFNSATLLNTEGRETQACVQFETQELLFDSVARDAVLDLMAEAGPNRAFGFVGALDATIRTRDPAAVAAAVDALGIAAMDRGVHVGKLCGGTPGVGGIPDPDETERVRAPPPVTNPANTCICTLLWGHCASPLTRSYAGSALVGNGSCHRDRLPTDWTERVVVRSALHGSASRRLAVLVCCGTMWILIHCFSFKIAASTGST